MKPFRTTIKYTAGASMLALLLAACAGTSTNSQTTQAPSASSTSTTAATSLTAQRQAPARGIYELAYSVRQNAVFVASSGGFGKEAAAPQILRLAPDTLAVQQAIPVSRKAFGIALDDTNNRLYVGNTVDTSVTVVDTQTNRELGVIQLMQKVKGADGRESYTHDLRELVVDPAANRLYVTGHSATGSVLFVVDTRRMVVEKTIPGLGNAKAPGLFLDAKNHRIFTSNLLSEVVVVDTRTLTVSKRIKTTAEQPMNLTYDEATNRLFATDQGAENIRAYQTKVTPGFVSRHPGNRVLVIDADSGKEVASLPTDAGPLAIKLDAPRQRLYVTSRDAGTVSIYDTTSYARLHTIKLPDYPQSLALDDVNNVLYVSIKNNKERPATENESVARIVLPSGK